MESGSPVKGCCLLEVFSWTLCFITNEKGAGSSKILNLFIHAPLLTRDDDVDISLDCVVSQRPLCGTLVRSRPLSLMFPYSRWVMIVLRQSLYVVVSDRRVLGVFVPMPPAVLRGFPQGASISLEAGFGRIVFSVLCSSCFTHGTKAP